jgi:Asp/Glu/hydantoin racemase
MGYLRNIRDILHVGSIATSAENASNFSARINVIGGNERSSCIVYERLEYNWKFLD